MPGQPVHDMVIQRREIGKRSAIMVSHWSLFLFFFYLYLYLYLKKNSCRLWECVKPVRSFATERFCTFPWPEAKKKAPQGAPGGCGRFVEKSDVFSDFSTNVHGREGAGKISFWKVGYLALWKHSKQRAISCRCRSECIA